MIVPLLSALNFTPSSTALSAPSSGLAGVAVIGQMVQLLLHTPVMVMLRLLLAVAVAESVTLAVKLKVPPTVSVPVMPPVDVFRVRPPGSVPTVMDQL